MTDIDNKSDNVANWKPSYMSTTSSATRETCMVFSLMLIMLVVTFCMQSTAPFLCNGSPSCFIKLRFLNKFCVCCNVQPLTVYSWFTDALSQARQLVNLLCLAWLLVTKTTSTLLLLAPLSSVEISNMHRCMYIEMRQCHFTTVSISELHVCFAVFDGTDSCCKMVLCVVTLAPF